MACYGDTKCVSLHPYFQIKPGKMDAVKAFFEMFVPLCEKETDCLYLGFTVSEDGVLFCREAYNGAAGVFAHLENAGEAIGQLLESADLLKLEVHGPADELDKLKEALAGMNPTYFTLEAGC